MTDAVIDSPSRRIWAKRDEPQPILAAREAKFNDLLTLLNFAAGNQDEDVNLRRKDRAPRFWVNATSGDAGIADFIVLGIGICFGAIHCMAWLFFTDSRTVVALANIECRYNPLTFFLAA